jgi:phosphatidylserine/phosphatidylglycerophosphate/cardiolipin synthase-like enzyme
MRIIQKSILATLSLGILTAVGCGSRQAPANFTQMRAPQQLTALNAYGRGGFQAMSNSPISAHFVNAYGETIAQNEPLARRDADGPAQTLLNLLASARQSIDVALYDLGDMQVAQALVSAKNKGVVVRVVTENQNTVPKDVDYDKKIPQPLRDTLQALKAAGIPFIDDNRSGLMHHKFAVIDRATVWTGSTNTTSSSLYTHNNNALTIINTQLAENYTYEFERMFVHGLFGASGPARQIPHPVIKMGNSTIRTFFSPKGGGTEAILDTVRSARQSISFMTFSFTDKDIANAMVERKAAGVKVEGVYDQCLGYGQYSTYHIMRQNGIYTRMDGNEALLHHKVILVDNTVITGSFNFSASADNSNNENMLIIEDAGVAQAYQQEYARVMNAAKTNNPPPNHCPGQPAPDSRSSNVSL